MSKCEGDVAAWRKRSREGSRRRCARRVRRRAERERRGARRVRENHRREMKERRASPYASTTRLASERERERERVAD